MKTLITVALVLSMLEVVGCASYHRSLGAYGTSFENIGSKKISVGSFKLYDSSEFSEAVCGDLLPGQGKWSGTYYRRPYRQVVLSWKVSDTGATETRTVDLALPREFGKYHSSILLYIDPDSKRVYVAYELSDSAKGIHMIVDSQGSPFDINQVKGAR